MIQCVFLIGAFQAATDRQKWRPKQASREPSPARSWAMATEESFSFPPSFSEQLQQVQETFRKQEAYQERLQTERAQELRIQEENTTEISELKKYLEDKDKELQDSTKQNKKLEGRNSRLLSELESQKAFNHGINTNEVLFQIQRDQARTIQEREQRIEELWETVECLQAACSDRNVVDEHNSELRSERSELMQERTQLQNSLSSANEEKNQVQRNFDFLFNKEVLKTVKDSEKLQKSLECELEALTRENKAMTQELGALTRENKAMTQELAAFETEQKKSEAASVAAAAPAAPVASPKPAAPVAAPVPAKAPTVAAPAPARAPSPV